MSVGIDIVYEGDLRCAAVHGPSGDRLLTDAPSDNEGRGRHFSPTDLVATSLGTCILTIMGIAAKKRGFSIEGARVSVAKHMEAKPRRHIGRIELRFSLPAALAERPRILLEAVAETCPVAASLSSDTEVDMQFEYVEL
jgi:putative redox protein